MSTCSLLTRSKTVTIASHLTSRLVSWLVSCLSSTSESLHVSQDNTSVYRHSLPSHPSRSQSLASHPRQAPASTSLSPLANSPASNPIRSAPFPRPKRRVRLIAVCSPASCYPRSASEGSPLLGCPITLNRPTNHLKRVHRDTTAPTALRSASPSISRAN